MTDQMEVDVPTPYGLEPFPTSSSFEKLDPAELDLDELNNTMQHRCHMWQPLMDQAEGDASLKLWKMLISSVIMYLTSALAATDAKSSVIATPTVDGAEDIVKGFNEAEWEHWKAGVRTGVEKNEWISLITHSTYILNYLMVGSRLIATAAKLRKRKVPNVALGVPIEYSAFDFSHFILLLCSHPAYHLLLRGWYVCVHDSVIPY
jgi:hypothetical protein